MPGKSPFTREQLRKASRDRLENPEPMVVGPRAEGDEVVEVRPGESRLRQTIPPRLEVSQLREPGPAPFRLYLSDDWDTDFESASGVCFDTFESAAAAAKSIAPGHRATVDNSEGNAVLRVVHHPEKHVWPY